MIGNAHHDSATERLFGGGKRERERERDSMKRKTKPHGPTIYVVQMWVASRKWMNSIDAGSPFYKRFAAEETMKRLAANGNMKYRVAEYVPK